MTKKASELADLVNGKVIGDADYEVTHVTAIDQADENTVSFISHRKYAGWLHKTRAGILLVQQDTDIRDTKAKAVILVQDMEAAKNRLINAFAFSPIPDWGISKLASINPEVELGPEILIGDFAVIKSGCRIGRHSQICDQVFIGENVHIGEDCIIYPGVKLYAGCRLGNRVIIHSNSVVGSDGFGYTKNENGEYRKIAHLGNVVIGDDVEIGSNTVIDRATLLSTRIEKGVKLDNLIQVGHNVIIQENTVIAAQAGFAGSVIIGKGCEVGGQAGFAGHISIEDGTSIQAKSGISKSITTKNSRWYGYPALKYFDFLRSYVIFRQLPSLRDDLINMKKDLNKLTDRLKKKDI